MILILPLLTVTIHSQSNGSRKYRSLLLFIFYSKLFWFIYTIGIKHYGNRTIASVKDNKDKLNKNFWSIYAMQIVMALFVIALYILYIIFLSKNKLMASIQIMYLFSNAIDINWFFFGIEAFKLTVARNTIIKIANLIMVFYLLKILMIYTYME